MSAQELLQALAEDSLARLRWRVDRLFGILPGSRQDREMDDGQLLLCGMHMVLDSMAAGVETENGHFDPERFKQLKELSA